ncbi:MAG: hypothetical protein ACK4UQ_00790 [Brevundimonas sp.]
MPTLVLLAGPNGAGKTTFINRFLRQRAEAFRSSILLPLPFSMAAGEGGSRRLTDEGPTGA